MIVKLEAVRSLLPFLLFFAVAGAAYGQPVAASSLTPAQAQALVERALATELRASQDPYHPMRFRLMKSSPRLTSTKEIVETRDGFVARLVQIDGRPLSQDEEEKEEARLNALLSDPSIQRHRKQNEDSDTEHAMKVLRALPEAFIYHFTGSGMSPTGTVYKFSFQPNQHFNPPDLETQILTQMSGELWIDAAEERVERLEGHLQQDVDIGWGILGRLNKGGWIVIEQADVGGRQWRTVRFQMAMSGRILFKNKSFDTQEEQTQFAPLPPELNYRQAIQMLRRGEGNR